MSTSGAIRKKRTIVRFSNELSEFSERYRTLLKVSRVTQLGLAEEIGGFNYETLSRIKRGHASGVPIDLIARLCRWAARRGFNVEWLMTGRGEVMRGGDALSSYSNADLARELHRRLESAR
jgi:transcriptional regulator with XRE-family HTH domain